jgi:hypothetical protein
MATVHERDDHFLFAVNGAPEAVLAVSERVVASENSIRRGDGEHDCD